MSAHDPLTSRSGLAAESLEHPKVHYDGNGVGSVKASEILTSKRGREELEAASRVAIRWGLRRVRCWPVIGPTINHGEKTE